MYSNTELLTTIVIIGLATFLIRVSFLYYLPKLTTHPIIKKGMEAIPASMLVALVIPFLIFSSQGSLQLFTVEVAAILLTIPVVFKLKNPGLGIIFAFFFYFSLQFLLE